MEVLTVGVVRLLLRVRRMLLLLLLLRMMTVRRPIREWRRGVGSRSLLLLLLLVGVLARVWRLLVSVIVGSTRRLRRRGLMRVMSRRRRRSGSDLMTLLPLPLHGRSRTSSRRVVVLVDEVLLRDGSDVSRSSESGSSSRSLLDDGRRGRSWHRRSGRSRSWDGESRGIDRTWSTDGRDRPLGLVGFSFGQSDSSTTFGLTFLPSKFLLSLLLGLLDVRIVELLELRSERRA